jgi:predicted membrane protein (TIGR00267 family)
MLAFFIKKQHERFKYYEAITGMSEIIRRSFVNNSFDGALTMLGVLLGSFITNITDPTHVLKLGLAVAIAVGISGLTGALFAETAERKRQLKEMERALHRSLENTKFKAAHDYATVLTALVDGLSPVVASILILMPFFFIAPAEINFAYQSSTILALAIFFLIGMFLGKISEESMIITGVKLVIAGLLCVLLILLLQGL